MGITLKRVRIGAFMSDYIENGKYAVVKAGPLGLSNTALTCYTLLYKQL